MNRAQLQRSDYWQLRTFAHAMTVHSALKGAELRAKIKEHGTPVIAQLQLNGHTQADAIQLIRMTLEDLNLYDQAKP
jgi:hypothetical protein